MKTTFLFGNGINVYSLQNLHSSPEKWCLEDFPFEMGSFCWGHVSFQGCLFTFPFILSLTVFAGVIFDPTISQPETLRMFNLIQHQHFQPKKQCNWFKNPTIKFGNSYHQIVTYHLDFKLLRFLCFSKSTRIRFSPANPANLRVSLLSPRTQMVGQGKGHLVKLEPKKTYTCSTCCQATISLKIFFGWVFGKRQQKCFYYRRRYGRM